MDNYKKYLIFFALFSFLISLTLSPIVLFVYKINENSWFDKIVDIQLKNDWIYWTALNQNTYLYKLELIKKIKPKLLAIWSSRVMQFREEGFSKSFVNAGWSMNHLNEWLKFLSEMIKFHKPDVILLWLDFWWLNSDYPSPSNYSYHNNLWNDFTLDKAYKPIKWIFEGKLSFEQFLRVIFENDFTNNLTKFYNIWIQALSSSNWYRKDWSYLYSDILFWANKSNDKKFKNTIDSINKWKWRFVFWESIWDERIEVLKEIVRLSDNNDIELVMFIPPLSSIAEKILINNQNHSYIDQLEPILDSFWYNVFNFHNTDLINTNDCEFVDWFHWWDRVYLKILRAISKKQQNMVDYLDLEKINSQLEINENNALSIYDNNKYSKEEVDFLKIWCNKK